MSSTSEAVFYCPQCQRQFKWDPRYAGRKATCRCGHVFEPTPQQPQAAAEDDGYGLADEPSAVPAASSAPAAVAHSAPLPAAAVPAAPPPPIEDVRIRDALRDRSIPDAEEDNNVKGGWFRNCVLPYLLIGVGLLIIATQVSWIQPNPPDPNAIAPNLAIVLILVGATTMLVAAAVASYLFTLDFGDFRWAIPKFCAISIFAIAMAIPLARFDRMDFSVTGLLMGCNAAILTYWILFSVFYRLELYEMVMSVLIVTVIQGVAMGVVLSG